MMAARQRDGETWVWGPGGAGAPGGKLPRHAAEAALPGTGLDVGHLASTGDQGVRPHKYFAGTTPTPSPMPGPAAAPPKPVGGPQADRRAAPVQTASANTPRIIPNLKATSDRERPRSTSQEHQCWGDGGVCRGAVSGLRGERPRPPARSASTVQTGLIPPSTPGPAAAPPQPVAGGRGEQRPRRGVLRRPRRGVLCRAADHR